MHQTRLRYISAEEYLEGELTAPVKHEYVAGEVYAMVGTSRRHNTIAGNLYLALRNHVEAPCRVYMADVKVRVEQADAFFYPDLQVGCDPNDREAYYLRRPQVVVEVLSPTTAGLDRREKWRAYRTLASLREYLLLHQDAPRAELFLRETEDGPWLLRELSAEDALELPSLGFSLPLAALYEGVEEEQEQIVDSE